MRVCKFYNNATLNEVNDWRDELEWEKCENRETIRKK